MTLTPVYCRCMYGHGYTALGGTRRPPAAPTEISSRNSEPILTGYERWAFQLNRRFVQPFLMGRA